MPSKPGIDAPESLSLLKLDWNAAKWCCAWMYLSSRERPSCSRSKVLSCLLTSTECFLSSSMRSCMQRPRWLTSSSRQMDSCTTAAGRSGLQLVPESQRAKPVDS